MAAPKLKRLTLQQYEMQTKDSVSAPLYVVNETGRNDLPRGEILLNVRGENNSPVCAVIQNTFIPIDLTQYAARRNLLESTEFKQLLSRRRISIVDAASVEKFFNGSERGRHEYERIYGAAFEATEIEDFEEIEEDEDDEFGTIVETGDLDVEFPEAEEIIALARSGEEDRAYDLLNSRGYDLKREALIFIDQKVTSTKLKELIAEILEDLDEA